MRCVLDWILSDRERESVQEGLLKCGQPSSSEVQSALSLAKNEPLSPVTRARERHDGDLMLVARRRGHDRRPRRLARRALPRTRRAGQP
jgi:hypothetical protein